MNRVRSPRAIRGTLTVVGAAVCVLWSMSPAVAKSGFLRDWKLRYPDSSSGDNASCTLCHGPSSYGRFNGYGFDFFQQYRLGMSVDASAAAIEDFDSDLDPVGFSNLDEILGSAQPGWTDGSNNTIYDGDVPRQTNQPPPSDIFGDLDPVPSVLPDIVVSPATLAFGDLTVGETASASALIENLGEGELTVTDLALSANADFSFNAAAPATPLTVPPGTSVEVPLDYSPSDEGVDFGTLQVSSDDPDQPLIEVALEGSGSLPLLSDIDVAPLALDFDTVTIGSFATQTATVHNLGTSDLTVNDLVLAGSTDFVFNAGAPVTPLTIGPGGMVEVPLDYVPSSSGADNGTLEVSSDDPDESRVLVALAGNGVEPAEADIDVLPLAHDFGSITIGETAMVTIGVHNVGNADLTVTDFLFGGSPDFALGSAAPSTPFVLAAGMMVDVPVHFSPSAAGIQNGLLQVASDDPDELAVDVALAGTGSVPAVPDIDVSPMVYDFGSVTAGETGTTVVEVRNVGEVELTIGGLEVTGSADFKLGATTLASTVAPGGVVGVAVEYSPSDVGLDDGTLVISSDDPDEPTVSVALSGTGLSPSVADIEVAPASHDFGLVTVGDSAMTVVAVRNVGEVDLAVSDILFSGSTAFSLGDATVATPFVVPPREAVEFRVAYSPVEVGHHAGSIEILSDDPDEPSISVGLTGDGTAVPVPDIAVDPLALDFGSVALGTTAVSQITLRNVGSADLSVSDLQLSGSPDFALGSATPQVPFLLGPGAAVDVSVDYTPAEEAADAGELIVVSDDPDQGRVLVALSGSGHTDQVDLDIAAFRVSKRYRLCPDSRPMKIILSVVNAGTSDGARNVTLVGIQNDVVVYEESLEVSAPVESRAQTIAFPAFVPGMVGVISWEATIEDDDDDVDSVRRSTSVIRGKCRNKGDIND